MKNLKEKLITLLIFVLVTSCATTSVGFSLEDPSSKAIIRTIAGRVSYNSYYIPSAEDYIEISLLDDNNFLLSSQKLLNVHKFPIGFVLRYDASEVNIGKNYRLEAVFHTQSFEKTLKEDVLPFSEKVEVNISF